MYIVYVYSENLKCAYLKVKAETGNKRKVRNNANVVFRLWKLNLNPVTHQDSMGHWTKLNIEKMDFLKPIHELRI